MPISINPGSLVIDLHSRQMEVLKCPANEIFWGGSCGGGKSFLARALAIIFCLELPEFSAFLFRRTFREIIDVHMKGPGSFPALLAGLEKGGRTEIKFFNGSSIKLCHLENPASDVFSYQGMLAATATCTVKCPPRFESAGAACCARAGIGTRYLSFCSVGAQQIKMMV